MKTRKRTLWHSILTVVFTASLILGNLVLFMPSTHAAATSVITSATYSFGQDGPAALDNNVLVHFTEPVCGNADCSAGLTLSNFTFTNNTGAGGFTEISSVTHTAGNDWALLEMDAVAEDAVGSEANDTVRAEDIYTASGMLLSDSTLATTPHGKPLTNDADAPTMTTMKIDKDWDKDKILLGFSEPVADEAAAALVKTDFLYNNDGVDSATDFGDEAVHSSDRKWVVLDTDLAIEVDDATDASDDSIEVKDNGAAGLFDLVGNEYGSLDIDIELSSMDDENDGVPVISYAYGQIGNDTTGGNNMVLVDFAEPVFNAAGAGSTADLETADFLWAFDTGVETLHAITQHTGGDTIAILEMTANLIGLGDIDGAAGDGAIFDAFSNELVSGTADTVTDNTMPVLRGVWVNQFIDHQSDAPDADLTNNDIGDAGGTMSVATADTGASTVPTDGSRMIKWTDSAVVAGTDGFVSVNLNDLYDTANDLYEYTQVKFDLYYEDTTASDPLVGSDDFWFVINDAADFTSPSEWAIDSAVAEETWLTGVTEVTVNLTATATTTPLSEQLNNPQYWGIKTHADTSFASGDILFIDNVRFSRGASSKSNEIILEYSESVDVTGDPTEGNYLASADTVGDMITTKVLAGFGTFTTGNITMPTTTNTVAKSADGKRYTITLANLDGGLITLVSPQTLDGLFNPTGDGVTDIATNATADTSTHTPETVIDTLDLITDATVVSDFTIVNVTNGALGLSWNAPAQTAATFSHYVAVRKISAGATVADTLFDDTDASALATATTSAVSLSGLTNGTIYYVNVAGVDAKGNATALVTERSAYPATGSGNGDATGTGPGAPSSFAGSVDEDLHVVLTWTDPSSSDLEAVQILRSFGEGVEPNSVLASVNPGNETYTDSDISAGDIVNYQLRGKDDDGAYGTVTETLTLTIEVGATSETEDVADEEEAADEEEPADEEPAAEEEPADEEEAAVGISFNDTGGHWAETEIEAMADLDIAEGHPDSSFAPNGNLNRAEAVALLYRVLGLDEPTAPDADPFPDVPADAWFAGYVKNMKALGMIDGYEDGTYGPGNNVTRAEFIKIALGVFNYVIDDEELLGQIDDWMEGVKTISYSDLADDWYTPYVTAATNAGFISGYACGANVCFGAMNEITRAEATVVLYNMFHDILTEVDDPEA